MALETAISRAESIFPPDSARRELEGKYRPLLHDAFHLGPKISYVGNKKVPLLRLYRFKEAFSLSFVQGFIRHFGLGSGDYVFDPFAGMGTTLLASKLNGVPSIGVDRLPVATFVARTLPLFLALRPGDLTSAFNSLRLLAPNIAPVEVADDVLIMKLAFPPNQLLALKCWKAAIDTLDEPMRDMFLLLFFSILEDCSLTSKDGQFLRLKPDKKLADPTSALEKAVIKAEQDLTGIRSYALAGVTPENVELLVVEGDARCLEGVPFQKAPTAIITSPPYANRYDYSRSYSLELCFQFASNFDELKSIRFSLLRSHIESKVEKTEVPPHPAVAEVVESLSSKKLNNPRIPLMLTGYFIDMEQSIAEWARVLAPGAQVAMVVDNVRFDGEMLPVDLILSDIAERYGFKTVDILIARYKGNSSQQMKTYGRLPVRESVVLWRKG